MQRSNKFIKNLPIFLLLAGLVSCGGADEPKSNTNTGTSGETTPVYESSNGNKIKAIMMGMVADPAKGGPLLVVEEYKQCIQSIKFGLPIDMYEDFKEQASEDDQYNDIKSVKIIETCPLPAKGGCENGSWIEYFYTDSTELLEHEEKLCKFSEKNKWITFDANTSGVKDE